MVAEDSMGSLSTGQSRQSMENGRWLSWTKMGHVDLVEGKFVGRQPCVDMLPQVIELFCWLESFKERAQNCQNGNRSRPPSNGQRIASCGPCVVRYHEEQARNHWWTATSNASVSINVSCNNSWRFKDTEGSCRLSYKGLSRLSKRREGYIIARSSLLFTARTRQILCQIETAEFWFHHQTLELNRHSLQWKHDSPFIHSTGVCRMRQLLAILRNFFHSSLLCTFSCHPSPPTILPSSLTSSCHLFLGLPLNLVVPKFIFNKYSFGNSIFFHSLYMPKPI